MAEIIQLRKNPHDEAQELLPWFVNGSLAPDEARRVEAHRAGCDECRSDLSFERQLAAAVADFSFEAEGAWERMRQLVNNGPASASAGGRWLRKRISVAWAAAAPLAAAAALGLVVVNVGAKPPLEPQYRGLATTTGTQKPNLIVQFGPATRVGDMERLLELSDARLVDGPTVTGAYLLRVDAGKRALALEKLRDNRAVSLAEPIDAPPGT